MQREEIILYKESKDSKLGVTFYRRDPQDGGVPEAAIISRLGATGPAVGKLQVGERIMSVQGQDVQGPLHAARLLRESEGYLRVAKLPKRADFDAKYEEYAQIEAENARKAMEAALPGQVPQSTPRTDAATPRGPGAGNTPLLTGLRVINGPGAPGAQSSSAPAPANPIEGMKLALDTAGANVANTMQGLQQNLGNLSARAGRFLGDLAKSLPTEENKKNHAALKIQKSYRSFAARGQFHEERGAVLMLQAASRRKKAQTLMQYKKDVKTWAACKIQHAGRSMVRRKKQKKAADEKAAAEAEAAQASARGTGLLGKLSRSLSFSKRNKGSKEGSTPRSNTSDTASTASSEPSPTETGAAEAAPPKKRSLSFTRRTKKPAAAAADEVHEVQQNV